MASVLRSDATKRSLLNEKDAAPYIMLRDSQPVAANRRQSTVEYRNAILSIDKLINTVKCCGMTDKDKLSNYYNIN